MAKIPEDTIYHYEQTDKVTITVTKIPLIRCKDCKDYDIINQPYDEGFCRKLNYSVDKDSFCSYGERRTDGEIH